MNTTLDETRRIKMKGRYEGSKADKREDAKGAKKLGVSKGLYERTAMDKREDAAGQRRMAKRGK
jgi:hypothetical protein